MIEIVERGLVTETHIDHRDGGVGQVGVGLLAPHDGARARGEQHGTGEKLIFVGAAPMRQDRGIERHSIPPHHSRPTKAMRQIESQNYGQADGELKHLKPSSRCMIESQREFVELSSSVIS